MSIVLKTLLRVVLLVLLMLVLIGSTATVAQIAITVKSFPTPEAGRITLGPDGALWFTEPVAGKIGRITTSGVLTEYAIPTANSFPFGITSGPDGALWFTELQAQKIGRITTDGLVTEYPAGANSGLSNITAGPDGALWFNKHCFGISRITTAGVVTDFPTVSCPFGMTTGPDGALWFADMYRVGRITTDGVITSYPIENVGLQAIVVGQDDALWFTGSLNIWPRARAPFIGRITTDGVTTKYPLPPMLGFSYLIAPGPDGALWFTNPYNNEYLGRITTAGVRSKVLLGGPCRYRYDPINGIIPGKNSDLWLSCSSGGIVQVTIPDTGAPWITLNATPTLLRPRDGRMVPVTLTGKVTDPGSGLMPNSLEYTVIDEYGLIQPKGHITADATGNYSFTIFLRASCEDSDPDGRLYTIRINARDNAGNRGAKSISVTAPL